MNQPLILIVEDDKAVRNLIAATLDTQDYRYLTAGTGEQGLQEATLRQPDIVLLDLGLPDGDGVSIIRRIRTWSLMPIIVISARSEDRDKIEALDAGADDYLTKPFEFEELAARIRALLRRRSPEKTDAVSVGDLTVEFSTRRVTRGGKEINLSSKEFALLESLIRHKGAVLSRTQLENQVWDYGFGGGSNIVDVYIRYLRKKLDDPFEKKLIHTIRGAGYTLREE